MKAWQEFLRRIAHLGGRSRFDDELDAEIQFHIEARADELIERGSPRDEALAQARREFGSRLRARESSDEAWRFRWFEDLRADIRYAIRTFRRSPAFTATAVASLALGIGASSAMFAALDAILWKPLPVTTRAAWSRLADASRPPKRRRLLPLDYVEQLRAAGIFSDLILSSGDGLSFAYDGRAERIVGGVVSPNFFTRWVCGRRSAAASRARCRTANGRRRRCCPIASGSAASRAIPAVIGRTIHLNTYPFTIVGVAPERSSISRVDSIRNCAFRSCRSARDCRRSSKLSGAPTRRIAVTARVKPSMTTADRKRRPTLASGLAALRLAVDRPPAIPSRAPADGGGRPGRRHGAVPGADVRAAGTRRAGADHCLRECRQHAARARDRPPSRVALRASIGAGRTRLGRPTAHGERPAGRGGRACRRRDCLLGIGCTHVVPAARAHQPGHRPAARCRVLAFTSVLSVLTGIVFGLAPALQASRRDLAIGLKADPAGASHRTRTRGALVVAQVALSLVLLIVAGWFIRAVSNLRPLDFRVPTDRVLLFTLKPQREIYDADRMRQLVAELHRRMATSPGVQRRRWRSSVRSAAARIR
jgi:hypothetical protein